MQKRRFTNKNQVNPDKFITNKKNKKFYQNKTKKKEYRKLTKKEIVILVKNNNFSQDWSMIRVSNSFDPNLVRNSEFYGRITIGELSKSYLKFHDLELPVGIYNSTIIFSDIGNNVAIKNVNLLKHYIIGDETILFSIDEMVTSNYAKFGNGILKENEDEAVRIWLEIGNENGGRKVLPFESMIPADAYIWSKYREDTILMEKFIKITESEHNKKRGYFGEVGKHSVIKNCRIIKDVKIGENAYIKGANKLKNLTVCSSDKEPTQIGEGVELVNGIIGYGNNIFYGCKAVRFVTSRNVQLKYGARLINSVLGDNSTVSCCELLNNLIFPFHEQHHNNSFLISTTVMGQSNVAAGATIGSNHNSRAPDGEIVAGRGFWPGLSTSFKHNSYFASFSLIAKGSYKYEINSRYPFALIFLSNQDNRLHIMPGYWFLHNMYAIARNDWKFLNRDKRVKKVQNIETEYLAPDTVSEILNAVKRIEYLVGVTISDKKTHSFTEKDIDTDTQYISAGYNKLAANNAGANNTGEMNVFDPLVMKKHGGNIVKVVRAWKIYREFALYFAVTALVRKFEKAQYDNFDSFYNVLKKNYDDKLFTKWKNIGGQIIPQKKLDTILQDIKTKKLNRWDDIHARYDFEWNKYSDQKIRYALFVLEAIQGKPFLEMDNGSWVKVLQTCIKMTEYINASSHDSRQKDYSDPFRKMLYDNQEEMYAVLGKIEDNSFLIDLDKKSKDLVNTINSIIKLLL